MCPSIQPLRLSERCDSDRGISKKSEYTQERKIRERVFELHAIKLSIPSCLNLLEREAAARYIGPFSSRRRRRRRTHLYSNVFSFPLASIFLETLLHPPPVEFYSTLSYPRSLYSRSCRTRRLVTDFNHSLSMYRFVLMGISKCYF